MSKRPDEESDMEAGMTTAERRRRRRRGAGLRVPSDNVPRRTSTPAVTPPVPEDPNLAVSIAYSFTAQDASGPVERRDTDELDRPDTLGDGPDDPVAPEAQATAVDPDEEDGQFAAKTREMTAVDLEALGLSDPSAGDGERRLSGQRAAVGPATRLSGPNLRLPTPTPSDPMRARTDPQLRAPTDPRVDSGSSIIVDDDLETSITTPPRPPVNPVPVPPAAATTIPGLGGSAPKAPTIPPIVPPATTSGTIKPMPVPVPTPSLSVKFRTPQPTPAPVVVPATIPPPKATPAPKPVAPSTQDDDGIWEVKSVEIDVEDVRAGAAAEDAPTVMRPIVDPAAVTAAAVDLPKKARASTMALADEDLEELAGAEAKTARSKLFAQSGETVALTDGDLEDVGRAASPKPGKLAKATKEESGEIVVDVVEEVDSGDVAKPVPPQNRRTPSGPIPTNGGTSAPGQRPPPPVPQGHAPGTTLPPPAPPAKHGADASHPPPPPAAKSPPPAPAARKTAPTVVSAAAAAAAAKPADPSKRAKRGKPWFEEIFDEDYLRTLPFLTPQATQAEAQFVIDVLSIQPGAQLLDLGCGYGRHAMELAARGFHLVGLDLSLPLLLRGADEAQRRGLSINFVHADMRELDFDAQFDGVYCLFSTFGYFDDETNKKTANAVARALKPGGRFVIEVLNRDYVIGELPTRVWWEGDGCVVLEEVEFNYFSSRIHSNRSVVFDDGRQIEQEISVRAYSLHELGKLLHSAGFRVVEVSGSVHTRGRYFGNQSRHIIVVAEKKPKESAAELPAK
jgi:SAM-dependent methyltransferase